MNFNKAFDKVPHQRLLTKFHHYGIRGPVLKWIDAFLTIRHQRVLVDGETSDYTQVRSRVPQGSTRPAAFSHFINVLPDEVLSNVRMFADGTVLYERCCRKCDAAERSR